MAKTLRALNDIIFVRANDATEVTESGIVLPGAAAEASNIGTVVATGPGVFQNGVQVPTGVSAGDTVMFDAGYARTIKFQGEELLVLAAENLLSVIE